MTETPKRSTDDSSQFHTVIPPKRNTAHGMPQGVKVINHKFKVI